LANGRPLLLRGTKVTTKGRELGAVVCVKAKGVKDAWCLAAIAIALLTILGAAGEATGRDRTLKTNTVKHRTLSLLNQGLFHYATLPRMKTERAEQLMAKFGEMLREQTFFRDVFGLI
jgi:hypothetical protein